MFHDVPHENAPGFSRGSVPGRPNHWKEGVNKSPESWNLNDSLDDFNPTRNSMILSQRPKKKDAEKFPTC